MNNSEVDRLVRQLALGFETLQEEYQKLHSQHEALERKLATAREQYNELSKLYGNGQTSTPPLSLSSALGTQREESSVPATLSEILDQSVSAEAASHVRAANLAATTLKQTLDASQHGVRIWSGPAADRPGQEGSSSMMPSISESPLEQDFTVEGKPSQLGCPFASMSRKKLSSHAASVLSRYNQNGSVAASTHPSVTSRVNGKESLSRRQSRRGSIVDPIKAEICGLSDHHDGPPQSHAEKQTTKPRSVKIPPVENADTGVCPIRFLDQHSPEEVATYFEKHKHELPRSHEDCVLRYQSNEDQIKELDAKYGNIVSMIQGLGQKHKSYLPEEIEDEDEDDEDASHLSAEKVRKWASSVGVEPLDTGVDEGIDEGEERQPHFERPLRDIRVGESPSRPWGIQVPLQYLEAQSNASSKPVQIDTLQNKNETSKQQTGRPPGKCPFGHGAPAGTKPPAGHAPVAEPLLPRPTGDAADSWSKPDIKPAGDANILTKDQASQMVFTGPVFIGYSVEDATKVLKDSGLRTS